MIPEGVIDTLGHATQRSGKEEKMLSKNKMSLFGLFCMSFVLFSACSGGGGSQTLSFQEGLPPQDISGTYKLGDSTVNENTCGGEVRSGERYLKIEQDGAKVTVNNVLDIDPPYTGEVSGSSFKLVATEEQRFGECKISSNSEVVGTVSGDEINITIIGTVNTVGCEDLPASCSISVTADGMRVDESSVPTQQVQGSLAKGTAQPTLLHILFFTVDVL